jgi:polyisoprenoid-binding protein YceI
MYNLSIFLLLSFMPVGIPPSVQNTYILSKAYKVTISGTSNLRNWKDSVGNVTGDMEAELNGDGTICLHAIHIKMEVSSIKSDMGSVMDSKTYKALRSSANPEIIFVLNVPVTLAQVSRGGHALAVQGNLTLAGICRQVTMQINSFTIEQGKLQFEGTQAISMTDYGVKPPTAFFGAIKARPGIIIHFNTNFTNKQFNNENFN